VDNEDLAFEFDLNRGDFTALRWKHGSNRQLCDQYWNRTNNTGPTTLSDNRPSWVNNWSLRQYSGGRNWRQLELVHPDVGTKRLFFAWEAGGFFVDAAISTNLDSVPTLAGVWKPGGDNDANDYAIVYGEDRQVLTELHLTYPGAYRFLWRGGAVAGALQDRDFDEVVGYLMDRLTPAHVAEGASVDGPAFYLSPGTTQFQFMITSREDFETRVQNPFLASVIDTPVRDGVILVGDTLRFSGHAKESTTSTAGSYQWQLGEGRSSALQNPGLVSFTVAGETTVTLAATASDGRQDHTPAERRLTVVADADPIPDLTVTQLQVSSNLSSGEDGEIAYAVRNDGDGGVNAKSWTDAVYLSRDGFLDPEDELLASTDVSRSLAVGESYTGTMRFSLPVLEDGVYYLLLSVDDGWELLERHQLNNERAVAVDVAVPRLESGVPVSGSFADDGVGRYSARSGTDEPSRYITGGFLL
jgi:hypothetical protein